MSRYFRCIVIPVKTGIQQNQVIVGWARPSCRAQPDLHIAAVLFRYAEIVELSGFPSARE